MLCRRSGKGSASEQVGDRGAMTQGPDDGNQADGGARGPDGVQATTRSPNPWWRNPVLMVPAGAALLAAIIGGVLNTPKSPGPPSTSPSTSPRPTASVPVTVNPTTPAPAESVGPSAPPPSDATAPTVWRAEDSLVIARGYGINLDKTFDESANWGYSNSALPSDLYFMSDGTLWSSHRVVQTAPDKAACDKPGYVTSPLVSDKMTKGTVLCVKSDEGRYARVTVGQVDQKQHTVTIDVLVWK